VDQITDVDQREYFKNFIVPVGTKMITDRFKINSTGALPLLNGYLGGCTDNGDLIIPEKYNNEIIEADFILFVGAFTQTTSTIAYATYCLSCKLMFL